MEEPENVPVRQARNAQDVGIDDVIAFLRRQGGVILITMAVAALVAAAVVVVQPRVYQSSATLVIFPPQVSSELKPATLSVLGFQQLLESDAVVFETRERLTKSDAMVEGHGLAVPANLSSRIFVSRRTEDKELSPMILAFGRGPTPEAAAAYANTWAAVFLHTLRNLVTGSTAEMVEFVDRQYEQQRLALRAQEDILVTTRITRRQEEDALAIDWLVRISKQEGETAQALATHQAETARLLQAFRGGTNLETRLSQLEAMRQALVELQVEQASVTSRLQKVRLSLGSLRQQLASLPETRSLRKAITDDALWQELAASGGAVDWDKLENRSLLTEEVNPIHDDVRRRIGFSEAEEASLRPRAGQLSERITELEQTMAAAESSHRADQAALVGIEQEREAGYQKLEIDRLAELSVLERRRDQALAVHRVESENRFAQLAREIEQKSALFADLAKSFNQAVIAKAQTDLEEVRLAAPAVPADRPQPRQLAIKAALAGILGGLIGLLAGLVRDRRRSTFEP